MSFELLSRTFDEACKPTPWKPVSTTLYAFPHEVQAAVDRILALDPPAVPVEWAYQSRQFRNSPVVVARADGKPPRGEHTHLDLEGFLTETLTLGPQEAIIIRHDLGRPLVGYSIVDCTEGPGAIVRDAAFADHSPDLATMATKFVNNGSPCKVRLLLF